MTVHSLQPRSSPKSTTAAALAVLALISLPPSAALASEAMDSSLTVTFHGIKSPAGRIMVALAADPAAYAGASPAAAQGQAPVQGANASVTFTGLKPGTYAIRAFHDLNGDGKLNLNPFGIPTEPYAFSNNARGAMGPAPWRAAAFEIKAGSNSQTIDID